MDQPTRPATIADLTALGVTGFDVRCLAHGCHQQGRVAFQTLGLPETTPFPSLASSGRLVCSACGSRHVEVFPDWTTLKAKGKGWV